MRFILIWFSAVTMPSESATQSHSVATFYFAADSSPDIQTRFLVYYKILQASFAAHMLKKGCLVGWSKTFFNASNDLLLPAWHSHKALCLFLTIDSDRSRCNQLSRSFSASCLDALRFFTKSFGLLGAISACFLPAVALSILLQIQFFCPFIPNRAPL